MLRTWSLKNFKSYKNLERLGLSSVNVLAGANSSGKSTIIQSILLLKQTLQYGSDDRAIALNGPILRMGSYSDLRNNDASGEAVDISFEFDISEDISSKSEHSPWLRGLRFPGYSQSNATIEKIATQLSFVEDADSFQYMQTARTGTTAPSMSQLKISVTKNFNDEVTQDAVLELNRRDHSIGTGTYHSAFDYDVKIDPKTEAALIEDLPEANIVGAFTRAFLPSIVGIEYDLGVKESDELLRDLFNPRPSLLSPSSTAIADKIPARAIATIREWLNQNREKGITSEKTNLTDAQVTENLQEVIRSVLGNRGRSVSIFEKKLNPDSDSNSRLSESIADLRSDVGEIIRKEMGNERTITGKAPADIERSCNFVSAFFQEGVRYLGPLRDSPRPVYQPEALESETDVGYRGEHTAAVLDINRRRHVAYYRPPNEGLEDDYSVKAERNSATLHEAVVEWLVYLGVADEVVTTDAGVYGNRLQVSTHNRGNLHDLTNVGVGVSQVLPIVVMALLAPKGSLLIFEQPELHLHPKVQARLADLFLALALDGKQMILETHSEYLIDRFRLRVALSETDCVRPLIKMLFSEKTASDTTLTPVELNEFGGVLNWPKDFFEQSQKDVSRILRATAKRRKSKLQD